MSEYSDDTKQKNIDLAKFQSWFFPLMILLIGISNLIVIFVGGNKYIIGEIELGILAEFIIYVNMLTWPVATVGWVTSIVQQAEASQKRINEFLKQKTRIENLNKKQYEIFGDIKFEHVTYEYDETNIKALNNLSFEIKKGQSLGILGGVGTGKSTIAELIVRNFDPTIGKVFIDGKNLRKHNLDLIRKNVGYVPQSTFLFSDTILNNIKFGNPESSFEKIIKYAKISNVHDDIMKFGEQYNSVLGERGINISGGQKQRIAIARAMIKEPSILILDDSLSAVDTKTEDLIFKNVFRKESTSTKIIISHRVSTLKYCDNIIVLKDGEIIQSGNHNKLKNEAGYYKEIYSEQMEAKKTK